MTKFQQTLDRLGREFLPPHGEAIGRGKMSACGLARVGGQMGEALNMPQISALIGPHA
jgi:hypothetical protein